VPEKRNSGHDEPEGERREIEGQHRFSPLGDPEGSEKVVQGGAGVPFFRHETATEEAGSGGPLEERRSLGDAYPGALTQPQYRHFVLLEVLQETLFPRFPHVAGVRVGIEIVRVDLEGDVLIVGAETLDPALEPT
jgi:hypothetical protein